MESLTKNRQSEAAVRKMTEKIFAPDELLSYKELTEGYFNAAYEVTLKSGRKTILKVAPPKEVQVMTYEKNIMYSEIQAMEKAGRNPSIPVAGVYGYDDSCTICPSPYFFMEKLEGESLFAIKESLTGEELKSIQIQTGKINRLINQISCPCFGYPGQPKYQRDTWFPAFKTMLELAVSDARAANINLKISLEKLWSCLAGDADIFNEVKEPKLVHWDCWDGNIFVKDKRVTGFIDWERSLYADPLMEVGFRTYGENTYFREGYGIRELTPNQQRRALWYDIYLMLLVAQEYEYRKYETPDMYYWATGILAEQMEKL